jgi:hypothetical protein
MARTSHLRASWLALGAIILAVSLAACSSTPTSAGPTSTSTSTTTGGSKPVCSLISPTEIRQATGVTVDAPSVAVEGPMTTCTYKASDVSQSVIIQYETGATPSSFAAAKERITEKNGPTSPVANLSEAFSSTADEGGTSVNTVALLIGSLQIVVISASPLSKVETLAAFTLYQVQNTGGSGTTSTTG